MEQPNYYSIIPANVRYDKELKANEKLLFSEITALANKQGYCHAWNSYFADLYGVSKTTISNWINHLKEHGYLKIVTIKDGKEIKERKLYPNDTPLEENDNTPIKEKFNTPSKNDGEGIKEKLKSPIKENFKENITSINTTSKNKDDDDRTRAHGENSAEKTFSLLNEYQLRQFKQGGHLIKLLSMVDEFGDDLVAWAIQQTVDSASSPNWNYFTRVIQRIQENNVHSVEEAVNLSKQHSEKLKHRGKVPRQPTKSKPNDVPDWLKQGQNMTPEERAEWQAKALQEELAKGDNA